MDNSFFNLFRLASESAANGHQSSSSRLFTETNTSEAIFRSEAVGFRFQALLEWNQSGQRRSVQSTSYQSFVDPRNAIFGDAVTSTSKPVSEQTSDRVFNNYMSSYSAAPTGNATNDLDILLPSTSEQSSNRQYLPIPSFYPSVFNPGLPLTTPNTSTIDPNRSAVIMSVVEGRGQAKGTVGMAAIDLYNPQLVLSQFTDTANYDFLLTKMDVLQPVFVLMPKTFFNENINRLIDVIQKFIKQYLNKCIIRPIERKYFNENEGIHYIKHLRCDDNPTLMIEIESKYYSLAACAALLRYIEDFEHLIYSPRSLRIDFEVPSDTMSIDPTTAKLLELIYNLNDPKSGHTLFGTINRTKTRGGHRLLRANILQPSTDQKLIENRLDMIEEIISSETIFNGFERIMSQLSSIEFERIISVIVQTYNLEEKNVKTAERKIETIIILKHILSLIEPMKEILGQCENQSYKSLIEKVSDSRFATLMTAINKVIEESVKFERGGLNMTLAKCHAIKKGQNALLDLARDTYSESIDDISHMVEDYRNKYEMPMKVSHSAGRGYYIEIRYKEKDLKALPRMPSLFIRVNQKRNTITCTTWDIVKKNNRINSSIEEIYMMSDAVINQLFAEIRQYIGCLYNLSDFFSRLDLIFSFASQCALGNYVRPEFCDYIAIKGSKHPILERVMNESPVPNDIFITEDHNFHIITGPNMSGKTTLLKQMALLQVMAQIGSFIPATHAQFRICDKLFSRIGNNDSIETSASTFMVEMREVSYILHNLTNRSLIIMDELGRGTSPEEAIGLCFAISERLIRSKAFTLFVTHFLELTKLENYFLNVENHTFKMEKNQIEENCDENSALHGFTHVLEPGVTDEPLYGIRLAKATNMEQVIVDNAERMAKLLNIDQQQPSFINKISKAKKVLYKLTSILNIFAKEKRFDNIELLKALQEEYRQLYTKALQEESQVEANNALSCTS